MTSVSDITIFPLVKSPFFRMNSHHVHIPIVGQQKALLIITAIGDSNHIDVCMATHPAWPRRPDTMIIFKPEKSPKKDLRWWFGRKKITHSLKWFGKEFGNWLRWTHCSARFNMVRPLWLIDGMDSDIALPEKCQSCQICYRRKYPHFYPSPYRF